MTELVFLQVPSIAGFVIAGTVVGLNALGFVQDLHQVEILAEIGVVLLLFGIGLELSLGRVCRLWRPIGVGSQRLVIAINDPDATARATRAARLAAAGLRITVRTSFDSDVKPLWAAGATCIVAAEAAAADAIVDRVLRNINDGSTGQPGPNRP